MMLKLKLQYFSPGSQASSRGEAKDSALLSSRDAGLLEPPERPQGSPVQETLKSLSQHHSSKASILWHSAFFMVQFSHLYMTMGKTIALTIQTFVNKVMFLLFKTLSSFVTRRGGRLPWVWKSRNQDLISTPAFQMLPTVNRQCQASRVTREAHGTHSPVQVKARVG